MVTVTLMDRMGQVSILFITTDQWRIQDFPEGGAWTLQGGREHAKFSRKLHEIERIWTPRGGVRPSRPPRSANADTMLNFHRKGESDVMCKQTLSIT